jgi:hypothetical protein
MAAIEFRPCIGLGVYAAASAAKALQHYIAQATGRAPSTCVNTTGTMPTR